MARTRTTKKLAQRIDLNYFKRSTPFKRAKFWLAVLIPVLAMLWVGWRGFAGDHRVYSSGHLSASHAVLERECTACHVRQAGAFSAKVENTACLSCHDGPIHHAEQLYAPNCASCHAEHRGRISPKAVKDDRCATCHAGLQTKSGKPTFWEHIRSFADGHPEFAALRSVTGVPTSDPGTIKLNHAIHTKPIRRSPNGVPVQLACGDCHRPGAVLAEWRYADSKYTEAKPTYSEQDEVLPIREAMRSRKPIAGREWMAPVKFAYACVGCHLLTFDKRFDKGVPHDKPQVVHQFVVREFREYIAAHSEETRVARDPGRDITGKPLPQAVRVLTAEQWVAERTADAEKLLWRKTCNQCHTLRLPDEDSSTRISQTMRHDDNAGNIRPDGLPSIDHANTTLRWMPHANFDHDAHSGFTCEGCHEKALMSKDSADILLPGIATCQRCHAPGPDRAESRCFECHTYHDWSKRKEVAPSFTLPALRTGGR